MNQRKMSIKKLVKIFPEGSSVIRDSIIETLEKLEEARFRVWQSYLHAKSKPDAEPICEATAEIIYESEIIPLERRLRRLCFEHSFLVEPTQRKKLIDLDVLKSTIDLRDYAMNCCGIKLKRINNRCSMGLCPIHEEKNPSCAFYIDHFYCFGCQAHGSIIDFVMQTQKVDFKEAINILKNYV